MPAQCDFLVIGGGIAGASAAYYLSSHGSVTQLERESGTGYHTTGRSAATLQDAYGGPQVRKLTRVSRNLLLSPPAEFCPTPLLSPLGLLHVGRKDQRDQIAAYLQRHDPDHAADTSVHIRMWSLTAEELIDRIPILRRERVHCGIEEPDVMCIDVGALHQAYLRGARRNGAQLLLNANVTALERYRTGWRVKTTDQYWDAQVVVNAAGAWGDAIAILAGVTPLGLVAKRRTAILIDLPADATADSWPMVSDIEEQFYFKPEAGLLLVSPADETPMPACDVQPDEWDIALLVDRIARETTLPPIRRVPHRWAGLRSFVADRQLVIGMARDAPGFFWLVGQGGYGIQTSAAAGIAAAALITTGELPRTLLEAGLCTAALSPERLATM